MLRGERGALPGCRLGGGEGGQPRPLGTTLHGGKRGRLRASPLPLGRDLEEERGEDNLPEASRGGRAGLGGGMQGWGTACAGAPPDPWEHLSPGSIPPAPPAHPSHLDPVDAVLEGTDGLFQLPDGGGLGGGVPHSAGTRSGAEPGGGDGGGGGGGGGSQPPLTAAELAGELPDGLLIHPDPFLLLQRRTAQLGRRAPQSQQLFGTGTGTGAGHRTFGA